MGAVGIELASSPVGRDCWSKRRFGTIGYGLAREPGVVEIKGLQSTPGYPEDFPRARLCSGLQPRPHRVDELIAPVTILRVPELLRRTGVLLQPY